MRIQVLLFAAARDLVGSESIALDLPTGANIGDLQAALLTAAPGLQPLMARSRFAVNSEFAHCDNVVQASDEVALIPPVSGG